VNYYFNLLGNLGPIHDPDPEPNDQASASQKDEEEVTIETVIICGCGYHSIDSEKDPYKQHNAWAAEQGLGQETSNSSLHNINGIGYSKPKPKQRYDFSGEEFEVTNDILRKHKK
jgi:hypothetical protein